MQEGGELAVGAETAVPEVLAQDVGQVGQVLDPHHPVVLNGHLVQYEVVPVLHGAHHSLLHLGLDVALHLTVTFTKRVLQHLQTSKEQLIVRKLSKLPLIFT